MSEPIAFYHVRIVPDIIAPSPSGRGDGVRAIPPEQSSSGTGRAIPPEHSRADRPRITITLDTTELPGHPDQIRAQALRDAAALVASMRAAMKWSYGCRMIDEAVKYILNLIENPDALNYPVEPPKEPTEHEGLI